jgi:hypothetical protein
MFVSFCLLECFRKCHVFAFETSPAGADLTDINMDESLFRVDPDAAIPEALNLCGKFVHPDHRETFDYDVCGVAQQVLTSFSATYRPVVFVASIAAGDSNWRTSDIAEFL